MVPAGWAAAERRTVALLAYLALEGPTSRSRLAGLLWPNTSERTSRNNLSQTLRRLKQAGLADHLSSGDPVSLAHPPTEGEVLALLRAHDFDDLPDYADWLLSRRERFQDVRIRQLRGEVQQAEQEGDLYAALSFVRELLDLDPLSEETHRQGMRLRYLLGDRAGALAAYRRCQEVFARELGMSPTAETAALAHEIGRSTDPVRAAPQTLPLSVQRPPKLVGREAAWQRMEHAWTEGRGVIVTGEPGIGKTRLLRDFAALHGHSLIFEGRPGDRLVPYSTHARGYRALLRQFPALALPNWVRRELSRIVPELGDAPPPLSSDAERLRFYQANTEALHLAAAAGLRVVAFDDLQYADDASVEIGEHSLSAFWGDAHTPLHTLHAYRSGELSGELEARIQALVSARLAVRITLDRLEHADLDTLLHSLGVPLIASQRLALSVASGGNPLLLLEATRHLIASGSTEALPSHLGAWLGERLQRLTPGAVQLARAAAILGPDLSAESAAALLGTEALTLTPVWTELEAAQILRGTTFVHDLLTEGVLEGLPTALRTLLHRRAAAALEPSGLAPARIARHWEQGQDPARSVAWWLRAASEARAAFRGADAQALFLHAAELAEEYGDTDAALESYRSLHSLLVKLDPESRLEAIHARFLTLARTPRERAEVWHFRAQRAAMLGRGADAEHAARTGLTFAAADPALQATLLDDLTEALWAQNRLQDALTTLETLLPLAETLKDPARLGSVHENLAVVLDNFDRHRDASFHHQRAAEFSREAGDRMGEIQVLVNLGISQAESGQPEEAVLSLQRALTLLEDGQGDAYLSFLAHATSAIVLTELSRYRDAQRALEQAARVLPDAGATPTMTAALHRYRARLALILGDLSGAANELTTLEAIPDQQPQQRASGLLLRAIWHWQQRETEHALKVLEDAEHLLGPQPRPVSAGSIWLVRAAVLLDEEPVRALVVAQRICDVARAHDLPHLLISGLTRAAQSLLALKQPTEARTLMNEALTLLTTITPADLDGAEVLLTWAQVLTALKDEGAAAAWQAARERVQALADTHVPPEQRARFLRLPLHRAVLAASESGVSEWAPLSDAQWAAVRGMLESPASRGRPRADARAVLDATLWFVASGLPWKDLPTHFPPVATVHRRYQQWRGDGTLQRVLQELHAHTDPL
ncbi:hypothetical protein GCM10008957_19030 [Deinococcus ruber]|uniref:Bacterial transcriptional activator domain-containing protein n=1 Tax=Deinococcus ruber TaxID=1848197 RepID=A0A918C5S5_9DEIO|nr:hypothetical protein GCM10008957_19030 [Deinococcus ruber]